MNHVLDNNIQTTATFKSESTNIDVCVKKKNKEWKKLKRNST